MRSVPAGRGTEGGNYDDVVGAREIIETPSIRSSGLGVTSKALLRAVRPKQWVKNLLVFLAPAAAGALGHPRDVGLAAAAGGVFILASSGTYLINDVNDIDRDRLHPTKRFRPIAAGDLSVGFAATLGVLAIALSIGAAWWLASLQLALVMFGYIVMTTSYSLFLKQVPYLELVLVASGFVLRAVAGGIAVHVSISPWFLVVTSLGALLIGTGKRTAEMMTLGDASSAHRSVIRHYTATGLARIRIALVLLTSAAYGLWAFSQGSRINVASGTDDSLFFKISLIPFIAGLLVLEAALRRGEGGEPESLAIRNRPLQLAGVICIGLVACGIYL